MMRHLTALALTGLLAAPLTMGALAQTGSDDVPLLGWTITPEIAEEGGTELDRLLRSPSGVTFGGELYSAQSDNPLRPVSVTLRALDKVTARFTDLEVPIGEEAAFGALTLLPRTCNKRPPEEFPETTAFLEVFSSDRDVQGRRSRAALGEEAAGAGSTIRLPGEARDARPALFRGWMFASSPALNPLEHPVYDVWVIDCKMVDPEA
jgi:hypothetical protein